MRQQGELSPFFALVDTDADARLTNRADLLALLDAVAEGDDDRAGAIIRAKIHRCVDWLIDLRESPSASPAERTAP